MAPSKSSESCTLTTSFPMQQPCNVHLAATRGCMILGGHTIMHDPPQQPPSNPCKGSWWLQGSPRLPGALAGWPSTQRSQQPFYSSSRVAKIARLCKSCLPAACTVANPCRSSISSLDAGTRSVSSVHASQLRVWNAVDPTIAMDYLHHMRKRLPDRKH